MLSFFREKLVKNLRLPTKDIKYKPKTRNKYLSKYENSLIEYLGTKTIISRSKSKGTINIHFTNNQDLERIMDLILNED